MKSAAVPLTLEEEERKRNLEAEGGGVYTGGSSTYIHGVAFPLAAGVAGAVNEFRSGSKNYLRLGVDVDKEEITLGDAAQISYDELGGRVPTDLPAFHFFSWTHDHDGASVTSLLYIFSCPDGSHGTKSAPVKARMLYSSSKANVENVVTSNNGPKIDLKLEINSAQELGEAAIRHELHPPPPEVKKTFAKPKRPGRGGARLNQ
jgi:twinfilin-like protein